MTAPQPRPRVVTAAFWCWEVASVLLIVGGLMAATVNIPVAYRGAGVITALAGAGVAYAAGRTRNGDSRFRRAAIALSMTIVILVSILAVAALMLGGAVATLTLLAVLPLVAGTVLITRTSAADWFPTGEDL